MKSRYSIFSLARNALSYHADWELAWRSPEPKPEYDVVIVGGGGHGLATAYYLAKEHGITNVAVLEKGWLGGGNTGRNTTIVRSNYLLGRERPPLRACAEAVGGPVARSSTSTSCSASAACSTSPTTCTTCRDDARRVNAIRLNGIDAEFLDPRAGQRPWCPILNCSTQRALSRCSAPRCSAAAASRATTRSPGATPAPPTRAASTSSRTAKSPASASRAAGSRASRPRAASSRAKKVGVRRRRPFERAGRPWPASACRSRAIRCRRWCRSRSSRCSTTSSCPARSMSMSASPTRASW